MKKKRFLYLLLAIALLAAFFIYRSMDGTPAKPAEPLVSSVLSVLDGASPSSDAVSAPQQEGPLPDIFLPSDPESAHSEQDIISSTAEIADLVERDGIYDSKDEVALYIHTFGCLPPNYITKDEAKAAGWSGNGGDKLDKYCPGKCIGGDRFGNREGLLPAEKGRTWTECDIGTLGAKNRGVKRIVFSNDGLIYYTGDHYESFELLYGQP